MSEGFPPEPVEEIVRDHIIRGKDPRDPAASRNGVKTRSYVAVIGPALLVFFATQALAVPRPYSYGAIGVALVVATKAVTNPINDAAEEWNEREGGNEQ